MYDNQSLLRLHLFIRFYRGSQSLDIFHYNIFIFYLEYKTQILLYTCCYSIIYNYPFFLFCWLFSFILHRSIQTNVIVFC